MERAVREDPDGTPAKIENKTEKNIFSKGVYLSKGDVKSIISTLDATLSHCFIFTQILRKYLRHFMHLKQSDIEYIGEDRKKLKNIIIQREFHGLECFYKSLVCAYEEEEDSNIFIVKEKLKELILRKRNERNNKTWMKQIWVLFLIMAVVIGIYWKGKLSSTDSTKEVLQPSTVEKVVVTNTVMKTEYTPPAIPTPNLLPCNLELTSPILTKEVLSTDYNFGTVRVELCSKIGTKWDPFGHVLSLPPHVISGIAHGCRLDSLYKCCMDMVNEWSRIEDENNWLKLLSALKDLDCNLAQSLVAILSDIL